MFSINGKQSACLSRQEFDIEEWAEKLIEFNGQFLQYFNNVIGFALPGDYNSPIGVVELIKFRKLLEELKN